MSDPSVIMNLATGYWNSATLLAANRLRLFDLLAEGPQTAAQIAERLPADLRGTTLLLNACVGLELLTQEGAGDQGVYRNSPASEAFLSRPVRLYWECTTARWGWRAACCTFWRWRMYTICSGRVTLSDGRPQQLLLWRLLFCLGRSQQFGLWDSRRNIGTA